jgi:hypothetical protein
MNNAKKYKLRLFAMRPKVQPQKFWPRGQKYKLKNFGRAARSTNSKIIAMRPKVQTQNFLLNH